MHKEKYGILLAEDDLNLGILLVDLLENAGFDVKLCNDGEKALKAFRSSRWDLCLLDVMMPQLDGFSLAELIRESNASVPIILITAKSLKADKLKGYNVGADDYITKPFDEEELLWKIKALIRRIPRDASNQMSEIIPIGKFAFDFSNQSLTKDGKIKRITEMEGEILKYLITHRNSLIKREDLLKVVWGENDYFAGRSLDVFITKIRKYLKDDSQISIENVFGVGFIFNVPEK